MATLKKKALSHFLRTNCERRLRLDLYPDDSNEIAKKERLAQSDMPPADSGRPALVGLREAGQKWEEEVFNDLLQVFENRVLYTTNPKGKFSSCNLLNALAGNDLPQFILEPSFTITPSFEKQYGLDTLSSELEKKGGGELRYAKEFRPDIIELIEPSKETPREAIATNGEIHKPSSELIGLRVIDIKLAATPSISYFAEVALYSMILAQWLTDNGLDKHYYVSADAAVWPGKYSGSSLGQAYLTAERKRRVLTLAEATTCLHEDLSILPKDVYTSRVKEFLEDELPNILLEPDWKSLPWHVSPACIGCEYLGYKWTTNTPVDEEHCWPKAISEGNLSQVIGVTRGASDVLAKNQIRTIKNLSSITPGDKVFDEHYTLQASRSVIADRASALGSKKASRAARSSNSLLPKAVDVFILIGVEFDISSGMTLAFSWKAWRLQSGGRVNASSDVYIVEEKTQDTERSVLLLWLNKITSYLEGARKESEELRYQVYLWDETSFSHLKRVISRHLTDILNSPSQLTSFSWMFPSDEMLPDPKYADTSRPLSIVKSLILNSVSADIPFYYNMTLLSKQYYPKSFASAPNNNFSTMYNDPLSDHIPSERAHDIWTKSERLHFHYKDVEKQVVSTCKHKLDNLDRIIWRANDDFKAESRPTAPTLKLLNPRRDLPGVSHDGEIWFSFASLNNSLQAFEKDRINSLDEYEREARFHSVRVDKEITGKKAHEILRSHKITGPYNKVFEVCERSLHSKVKTDSIGYSLLPESLTNKGSYKAIYFLMKHGITFENIKDKHEKSLLNKTLREIFSVSIRAFNREERYIIVDFGEWNSKLRNRFLQLKIIDFSLLTQQNRAIIDPIHIDLSLKKIKNSIKAIKNPPLANKSPLISLPNRIKPLKIKRRQSYSIPCESFIWGARSLSITDRNESKIIESLNFPDKGVKEKLNESQKDAVKSLLQDRLSLIWGPPGTGKTSTLAKGLLSLFHYQQNNTPEKPLRVLVTGYTWVAIDTLCGKLVKELSLHDEDFNLSLFRLFSSSLTTPKNPEPSVNLVSTQSNASLEQEDLLQQLIEPTCNSIVFATPQQTYNLRTKLTDQKTCFEMFDHIIVDEASQLDMSSMMMIFPSFSKSSSLTVVGDDKQMPPIFQAELPLNSEKQLGSIFTFYSDYWQIPKRPLHLNYRSNQEIVDFSKKAGYANEFGSYHRTSKVALKKPPIAGGKADDWLNFILDPDKALICIVHDDKLSPQKSEVETDLTAQIVNALRGNLAPSHQASAYSDDDLFKYGIGIVTPHVAQKSSIYTSLTDPQIVPKISSSNLYESIDTVERFQGQEKDVIIISYALSDRDSIMQEEEFIFGLERFNVAISRAKHKAIVLISKELVKHIPQDIEVVEASRLLKLYASNYLKNSKKFSIKTKTENIELDIKYSERS